MDRLLVLLAVLAVTGALAAWWRARDGRVVHMLTVVRDEHGFPRDAADLAAAVAPRTPLVLVEFTAPDCVPCARTKVMLDEAAASRDDLSVVTVDVADALDLARAHRILRAPTTLLITAEGHLLGRVAGIPRLDQLVALLHDDGRVSAA
ncbi:MAG TPA: thioredoxin family protein [Euzebya sp.]|nr:thioredoxin family protein [Euzebya sp.]